MNRLLVLILTMLLSFTSLDSMACSMCKVTINGHTYLGNNEDSWRMGSRVWFEQGAANKLGALYVSYDDNFPQGGMNEAGLAFDGLTINPKKVKSNAAKKTLLNPGQFIKEIMQTCKTVEDVEKYATQYTRQRLNGGVMLFADKSGKYLVLEPDTIIIGGEDKYIIANFCPSTTSETEKLNFNRYKRGNTFLINHQSDVSESYCLALTDTMHECRGRMGDGTLYSYIADLQKGEFNLYFYHDYKHRVSFNLAEELAKGNRTFEIPALFPPNAEYEKLRSYKTPRNSRAICLFLIASSGLFLFSSVFFLASYFPGKRQAASEGKRAYGSARILLVALSLMLLYYHIVLVSHEAIFYFHAPYHDYRFSMLNIAAYIPFVMLAIIFPLCITNAKIFKKSSWNVFSRWLFTLNNLTYLALICIYAYWGLYSIL